MQVTTYLHKNNFDNTAVDMARVSFSKKHINYTKKQNTKLINYLITHNHWTPFAHSTLCIYVQGSLSSMHSMLLDKELMAGLNVTRGGLKAGFYISGSLWAMLGLLKYIPNPRLVDILLDKAPCTVGAYLSNNPIALTCSRDILIMGDSDNQVHSYKTLHLSVPIFVARQLDKHVVGFVKNEVSRRYIATKPTFFKPDYWRGKAKDKKQGSSNEIINFNPTYNMKYYDTDIALTIYQYAMDQGVCEEQARMLLPQSMYTEYYLTANLKSWNRLLDLRLKEDTQYETREVAKLIKEELI